MSLWDISRYALAIGGAGALLAGCGGAQPPTGAPGAMLQTPAAASRAYRGRSWMLRGAATSKKLAYVSNHLKGVVNVYSYPSGARVGQLTGFTSPRGQCVDAAGDVFITDFATTTVVEYAHGGTKPIMTLSTGGTADACSVAPNGDLAVANNNTNTGAGDVAVFKNASGSPKYYANKRCSEPIALGYDSKSNLYVQSAYVPTVCEVKHAGTSMSVVKANVMLNSPIGVMWDGKHITLADDSYSGSVTETAIYQMKESTSGDLTKVGDTVLTDTQCNNRNVVFQPFILGATNTPENKQLATLVVGPNSACASSLFTWSYPKGGDPEQSFKTASGTAGQSVSIAQ